MLSKILSIALVLSTFSAAADTEMSIVTTLPDGIYRGIAPSDESEILLGEIEFTVTKNVAKVRIASGIKIIEGNMDLSEYKVVSDGKVAAIFTGGLSDVVSPLILFYPELVASGEFELAVQSLNEQLEYALPRLKFGGKTASPEL